MIKQVLRLATGALRNVHRSPQFLHTKSPSQKMICQIINKTRFYFSQSNSQNVKDIMLRHWHAMETVLDQKQFYVSASKISPSQNIKNLTEQQLQMLKQITSKKKKNQFRNPSQKEKKFIKDKLNPDMAKIIKDINQRAEEFYLKKLSQDQQKMTSLWQIKKLLEKSFLWNLKYKNQNESLKAFADYFLIQYTPYLLKLIAIITSNGEVGVSQSKQTFNQEMPMSLRQIILVQLKLIKDELDILNLADPYVNSYFFQCFESLFKIGQNSYWEYCLLDQQERFSQTTQIQQSDLKQRIIFTPTVYTSQVFKRIFNKIILSIAGQYSQTDKHVNYFMGQKYNGKSHSITLSRILFGHLTDFKALSISTFQGKSLEIQTFVNHLGNIMSRDLWYHLDKVNIEKLNNVKMNTGKQKFIQNFKYQSLGVNPIIIFAKEIQGSQINSKNIQAIVTETWFSKNQGFQYQKFRELISILKSLDLKYLIIDQFNYFGRELYKLQNIKKIKDQHIAKLIQKTFVASQLYKVNTNLRLKLKLFASTNNYTYKKLFQAIFGSYSAEQNITKVRSYLFSGTEVVNQVHFHLSQYYSFHLKKNQTEKKWEIYSKIFLDKNKLKYFCSLIPYGLSLKECQTFSQSLIINFEKKLNQFSMNKKEQKTIIEDIFNSSIQKIKQVVMDKVYDKILLHITQNCKDEFQAQEMLQYIVTLNANQNSIHMLSDYLQKSKNQKTYNGFFQAFTPLNQKVVIKHKGFNLKLHKGYQEFCDYFKSKQRFQKLIEKVNTNRNFNIPKELMRLNMKYLQYLKEKGDIDKLLRYIRRQQINFGSQFQQLLLEYFRGHSIFKTPLKFTFQLNGKTKQFQFNKVVIEKVNTNFDQENIIKKVEEATKQLNTLTVVKMHDTNQACDFQLFFKVKNQESEEETAYMIALEVKTGKKLIPTQILKKYLDYSLKSQKTKKKQLINQNNIQTLVDNKIQFIYAVGHSSQKLKIDYSDNVNYKERLTTFKTSDAFPQSKNVYVDEYRNALLDARKYAQQQQQKNKAFNNLKQ